MVFGAEFCARALITVFLIVVPPRAKPGVDIASPATRLSSFLIWYPHSPEEMNTRWVYFPVFQRGVIMPTIQVVEVIG